MSGFGTCCSGGFIIAEEIGISRACCCGGGLAVVAEDGVGGGESSSKRGLFRGREESSLSFGFRRGASCGVEVEGVNTVAEGGGRSVTPEPAGLLSSLLSIDKRSICKRIESFF